MLSGNAADDGESTCLAAIPLMMHALAGVLAFVLCDRDYERTAFRANIRDILHHGDLSWEDVPAIYPFPLPVVMLTVPPLMSASSWTAPPGPRASRRHVREIRVGLGFVGSPEVPLKLPFFRDPWGWRDLRDELPCSIHFLHVADLFLVNGQL